MPPTRAALVDQLVRLIDVRLLDPLEILLDGHDAVDALRTVVRVRATAWAHDMVGGDDPTATRAAMRVVATLYPDDGPFEPPLDWWRTPLGQTVVRRIGHPAAESVSYAVAGAMLGISRQGVHDLVTRGKLVRHEAGGVTPASVRARLLAGDEGPARHA